MDPSQFATVPLGRDPEEGSRPCSASGRAGGAWVRVSVYTGRSGSSCGRLLGVVSVPVNLRAAEGRSAVVHDGWVSIGGGRKKGQLFLTVRAEPNPRCEQRRASVTVSIDVQLSGSAARRLPVASGDSYGEMEICG